MQVKRESAMRAWRWWVAMGLAVLLSACSTLSEGPDGARSLLVPASRLQRAVDAHFPYKQGITGWLDLRVESPRLALVPERNRITADVDASLSGRWIERSYHAALALEFGLRFEPSDNSIRVTQLQLTGLQVGDVPEYFRATVRQQAPAAAQGALVSDMVLYRFSEDDIRKAREAGYRPADVRVTHGGIRITLVPI